MDEVWLPHGRYAVCDPAYLGWRGFFGFMYRFMTGPSRPGSLDVVSKLGAAIIFPYDEKPEIIPGNLSGMFRPVKTGMTLLGIIPVEKLKNALFWRSFPVIVRGPLTARLDGGILSIDAFDDADPKKVTSFSLALDRRCWPAIRTSATPEEVVDDILSTARELNVPEKETITEILTRLDSFSEMDVSFELTVGDRDFAVRITRDGDSGQLAVAREENDSPRP